MNRYVVTVLLFLCPATSLLAVAEEVPAPDWASYSEEVNLSATDWLDNSGNAFQALDRDCSSCREWRESGVRSQRHVESAGPFGANHSRRPERQLFDRLLQRRAHQLSNGGHARGPRLHLCIRAHSIGGARMDGRSCSHAFDYSYRRDRYQRLVQRRRA